MKGRFATICSVHKDENCKVCDAQKYMDKILTPEFIAKSKKAEEKRLQAIIEAIENESEPFLEKLRDWINDLLSECYSYTD